MVRPAAARVADDVVGRWSLEAPRRLREAAGRFRSWSGHPRDWPAAALNFGRIKTAVNPGKPERIVIAEPLVLPVPEPEPAPEPAPEPIRVPEPVPVGAPED